MSLGHQELQKDPSHIFGNAEGFHHQSPYRRTLQQFGEKRETQAEGATARSVRLAEVVK